MDTRLSDFPYVTVRVQCPRCERYGAYKLARLAARYGPETLLSEVIKEISIDCMHRRQTHPHNPGCRARCLDWPPTRPPDEPFSGFKVVRGGRAA